MCVTVGPAVCSTPSPKSQTYVSWSPSGSPAPTLKFTTWPAVGGVGFAVTDERIAGALLGTPQTADAVLLDSTISASALVLSASTHARPPFLCSCVDKTKVSVMALAGPG